MATGGKITVIIPAFNEARSIEAVIGGVRRAVPSAEILVVDDGSDDGTPSVSAAAGARVIRLPYNAGYGAALQTGYMYAVRTGAAYCLQLDADGQHEPGCLPDILDELSKGNTDVVIGARRFSRDGSGYCSTVLRRTGIRFFAALSSFITKKKITDTTSGFIGYSGRALRFLVSDYFPGDYPDADVIIMLHRLGYRIMEIPVVMSEGSGKSMHGGLRPALYVVKMIFSIIRASLAPFRSLK